MKLLLIHSNGVEMEKKAKAMARPQDYDKDKLKLDGLVLVAYVSVEDQDTFDVDIISNQAVNEIMNAVELIESFPQKIEQQNAEITKFNAGLAKQLELSKTNPKVKAPTEQPREMKSLIMDEKFYKVDRILVYPWAHLSNFLSNNNCGGCL